MCVSLSFHKQEEQSSKSSKAKWRYLQKYWHKGAFFQNDADDARGTAGFNEVYNRDYSAPTGEDLFDKSSLPEVMQVWVRVCRDLGVEKLKTCMLGCHCSLAVADLLLSDADT